MIICICGDFKDKNIIINELKEVYKDKLVMCDYYRFFFQTLIKTQKYRYELDRECKNSFEANKLYITHVNNIVFNRVNEFLENNKDKIIVLITNNILSKDLDKTRLFDKSNLKILVTSKGNDNYILKSKYDKNKFDYVIDTAKKSSVKKLVKL